MSDRNDDAIRDLVHRAYDGSEVPPFDADAGFVDLMRRVDSSELPARRFRAEGGSSRATGSMRALYGAIAIVLTLAATVIELLASDHRESDLIPLSPRSVLILVLAGLTVAGIFGCWLGLRRVPNRAVGIVYRRYGRHPQDNFRVSVYGSVGPQAAVLPPNSRHWLLPFRYAVRYMPQIYVPDGTIGLVEAKDGMARPPGRRLGRYVECDYFQDGEAFLLQGGEQGRQLGYLPGGAYYSINTELFNVITVATIGRQHDGLRENDLMEVRIPVGNAGVVIVMDGTSPNRDPDAVGRIVEGHDKYRLPWVFLSRGGQRGVQEETLDGGGSYAINPWFARVVQIPTRDLYLEWTRKEDKSAGRFDLALDQIVVDIQGHRLSLEVSQVLRIPPSAAPRLVGRFGEAEWDVGQETHSDPTVRSGPIQRFVERVVGAEIMAYFSEIVACYGVLQFIREYDSIRLHLEDRVTCVLNDWGLVAGRTVFGEFKSEDSELNKLRRSLAGQDVQLVQEARRHQLLESARTNQDIEAAMTRVKLELKGESEVVVLRKQIEQLGQHQVLMERLLEHMAKVPVPQYIAKNSGDITERILNLMPLSKAQDMLKALIQMNQEPEALANEPSTGKE